ncbi:class I SAM-dependent methyltransferase [Tichowtungia aerotolerans]|uniref:Methyltransferase domain-containing protein n=1 Tax=Tichowtungia aerotolerans TaxID=2697043 RepID=A0A6P1M485_9BACT|nr:methyltransferase domain-containing protein [Tichowtungia aerotolerans]QHI69649.1 methyltransferase domain-containing protein [Tichowtungia aerotolerans]
MNTQNLSDAGSYKFGRFEKNAEELERLKLQATIALKHEQKIWEQTGLKPGMNVLDLACGPGFTACELAKIVGDDGQVTGIDINEELIATAHQAKESEGVKNVSFTLGNLYELDLPENSFDFVYARFVFQHLEKPELALSNIRKILKPGGILCILDIDDNWTSFSPGSDAFIKFIRKAGAGQKQKGGNRLIGSQLYGLLNETSYQNISTQIHPITTEDLGIRYFLGVAVLFRVEMLNKVQKLLALPQLRTIKKAAEDPKAWGALGIFVTSGRK